MFRLQGCDLVLEQVGHRLGVTPVPR
jgi:hypothetical protein